MRSCIDWLAVNEANEDCFESRACYFTDSTTMHITEGCNLSDLWVQCSEREIMPLETMCLLSCWMVEMKSCMWAV